MRPKDAINVEEMEVIHLNEIDPTLIPDHVIKTLYNAIMPAIAELERKKAEEVSQNVGQCLDYADNLRDHCDL